MPSRHRRRCPCRRDAPAKLVRLEANPHALRSYNRDIATLFGGSIRSVERGEGHGRRQDRDHARASAIRRCPSLIEEWGGVGLIAVNPGIDIHWGTCTTIWGSPDLAGSAAQAEDPGGGGEQSRRARADGAGRSRRRGDHRHRDAGRLVHAEGAGGDHSGHTRSRRNSCWCTAITTVGTSASATTRPAMRRCWSWRACCGRGARELKRSVKLAWWPGHSTGRYAGSTWFTDAFALDIDRNCLAQINCDSPGCRWATSYHQTRALHRECGAGRGCDPRRRAGRGYQDACVRRRPATTASTISACRASSC